MNRRQRQWYDATVDYEVELRPEDVAAQVAAQWRAWIETHQPCPICGRLVADHTRRERRACDDSRPDLHLVD